MVKKIKNIQSYQDLEVWQKAMDLVVMSYQLTKQFPKSENFGLSSQLQRAAVSVPANIAEGFKKRSHRDKLRFFNIAQGSAEEVRYYLILSADLKYGDTAEFKADLAEVSRMLEAYMRSIRKDKE